MSDFWANITQLVTKAISLIILGSALWQARRLASDIISNADKLVDKIGTHAVARKAMADFCLSFAAVMILIAGIFEKLQGQLFVALFVAALIGLGVRIVLDSKN